MNTSNLMKTIKTSKQLASSIVVTRCTETPIINFVQLAKDLTKDLKDSGDTTSFVSADPTGSILTILVPKSESVLYLKAAATSMKSGEVQGLILYRSRKVMSAFSTIAKSITNIHGFSTTGTHSCYADLQFNFQSLFELNTFFEAANYVEDRLGIPVTLLSTCELKTYSAFVDTLMQEGILPPKSKAQIQAAPKTSLDSSEAEKILLTAQASKKQKAKRSKCKITIPKLEISNTGDNASYCEAFLTCPQIVKLLEQGLGTVRYNSINNPEILKPLLYALMDNDTKEVMQKFFDLLFFHTQGSIISRLGLFQTIVGGLAHNNLPRRKAFMWHNYNLDLNSIFEKLVKNKSEQLVELLDSGHVRHYSVKYDLRDIGSSAISFAVKKLSMDFETAEIIRYSDSDLSDNPAFLAQAMFNKVQSSCGTMPALMLTLNSIFMGE
jgi:hypothetical protein